MTPPTETELRRECAAFTRYLTGIAPAEYITQKYHEGHERTDRFAVGGRFDALLVRLAARGPHFTAFADAYACVLARRSALRKKLILLAAILESCPPKYGFTDQADAGSSIAFSLGLALRGIGFGLRLLAAVIALGPLHLVMRLAGSPPAGAGQT